MVAFSNTAGGMPPFVGAKTSGRRIPVDCAMARQALVQASLDPAVEAIDFIATAQVRGIAVPVRAIVLIHADGPCLLDLADAEPPEDIDAAGLRLLGIEALEIPTLTWMQADLNREPWAGNCSTVWASHRQRVAPDDRVRILHRLEETPDIPLIELASVVQIGDGAAAIFALACEDRVELDLASVPVGPSTAVSLRQRRGAMMRSSP